MIYDLSQPIFNNVPQWPKFRPTSITIPHLTATESGSVERLGLMTHTGTHIDAPFHFFSDAETVDEPPRSHSHAPCVALDLRHKEAGSIGGSDDPGKETAAYKVLLGTKKPIIEDIRVPEAMLDGRMRHFAAFYGLIEGAGRAWTRAVAWDEGEMS